MEETNSFEVFEDIGINFRPNLIDNNFIQTNQTNNIFYTQKDQISTVEGIDFLYINSGFFTEKSSTEIQKEKEKNIIMSENKNGIISKKKKKIENIQLTQEEIKKRQEYLLKKKNAKKFSKKTLEKTVIKGYERQKNLTRYIIRWVIANIEKKKYSELLSSICQENNYSKEDFTKYFVHKIKKFTNIKIIRNHWILDDLNNKNRNLCFVKFCKILIEKEYPKYAHFHGKMDQINKFIYLEHSRKLLHNIQNPKSFLNND